VSGASTIRPVIRNNGVEQGNLERRLAPWPRRVQRRVTKHTVARAIRERLQIMQKVKAGLETESKPFGIEIIDVRIKRVDFVADVTASVYNRITRSAARSPTSCVPRARPSRSRSARGDSRCR